MTTNKPAYLVYTVKEGKGSDKARWNKIGVAFGHKDGKGFSIILDEKPADGRLTLRKAGE